MKSIHACFENFDLIRRLPGNPPFGKHIRNHELHYFCAFINLVYIDFRLFRSRKKYLFLFYTESLKIKSKGSLNSKQRLNFQLQKVKKIFKHTMCFLKTVFSASCVLREKSVHRRNRFSWNQLYAKCAGKNKSRGSEQNNDWAPSALSLFDIFVLL